MVLAIGRPEMEVVLIERSQKKARFLQQVVYELKLGSVEAVSYTHLTLPTICSV